MIFINMQRPVEKWNKVEYDRETSDTAPGMSMTPTSCVSSTSDNRTGVVDSYETMSIPLGCVEEEEEEESLGVMGDWC